jgi:hypothetical protein
VVVIIRSILSSGNLLFQILVKVLEEDDMIEGLLHVVPGLGFSERADQQSLSVGVSSSFLQGWVRTNQAAGIPAPERKILAII